jgi:hypothetical protein
VHAALTEPGRNRASDAATGAGNESDATVEIHSGRELGGSPNGGASILLLQPRQRHAHATENTRPFGRTMPIGTAARDETEKLHQRTKAGSVLVTVPRVSHLESIESQRDESLDDISPAFTAGMRQHRETAARVNERNCLAHRKAMFWYERRSARTEVSIERIARIARPATLYQDLGHMGAS